MALADNLELLYPSVDTDILSLIIEQAQAFVLDYCNIEEIPQTLNSVLLDMCKQDVNKLLAEGFSSETAGGSSVTYESDYTPQVYKRLRKHKRMRTL